MFRCGKMFRFACVVGVGSYYVLLVLWVEKIICVIVTIRTCGLFEKNHSFYVSILCLVTLSRTQSYSDLLLKV